MLATGVITESVLIGSCFANVPAVQFVSCAAPRLARVLKHAAATQDPLVFSQNVSSPHDFVAVWWLHPPAIFSGMFNMLAQGLFAVVFNLNSWPCIP